LEGWVPVLYCPFCRGVETRVIDSRTADDGAAIRRRRQCAECGRRFTTAEHAALVVVKRSGATEPFSRPKVLVGVRKACQGRPVTEDDEVAYLRFASVYRSFESLEDFESEITLLRAEREPLGVEPPT
jgi:transcriptional repressor NrdR